MRIDKRVGGFTLLELIVAVAVFSVVSVLAYGGLRTVLSARDQTDRQAENLATLQRAILTLERDIGQFSNRPIRDEYGDSRPPLRGGSQGIGLEPLLELTRAGWSNPARQQRSTEQRVAYLLEGEKLIRLTWSVLDRSPQTTPLKMVMLERVRGAKVRFLDPNRQWADVWPPQSSSTPTPAPGTPQNVPQLPPVPLAIEVTLDVEGWGQVVRLFRLQ